MSYESCTQIPRQTDIHTDIQTDRQIPRQTDRHTDIQTERQTSRQDDQTQRQTEIYFDLRFKSVCFRCLFGGPAKIIGRHRKSIVRYTTQALKSNSNASDDQQ